jgi:hypothetical protein
MIDSKHTINLQGKDFVKYEGLLNAAHERGLQSIETEEVCREFTRGADGKLIGVLVIFKAAVTGENKKFTGYGDATEKNVNRMVLPHLYRMAETRAKARALRDFCNIGMCSVEELGE